MINRFLDAARAHDLSSSLQLKSLASRFSGENRYCVQRTSQNKNVLHSTNINNHFDKTISYSFNLFSFVLHFPVHYLFAIASAIIVSQLFEQQTATEARAMAEVVPTINDLEKIDEALSA